MYGTSMNLHPLSRPLLFYPHPPHRLLKFSIPTIVHHHHGFSPLLLFRSQRSSKHCCTTIVRATRRESPFEVLGIPPSATSQEIKRAYRKLALKYHPDVNKEANAQERFMRIKHAYNTLINSEKYDSNSRGSDYSRTSRRSRNQTPEEEEEFYGLGNFFKDVQITIADLFRDLQAEYQNWDASISSQEKPKSLWEELADIGEEFVEFLEKELNINDTKSEAEDDTDGTFKGYPNTKSRVQDEGNIKSNIEENIDDIEAALAQLKKDLGL